MLEKLEITELTSKNSIEMLEQYKEETKRVKEKADDTIHLFLSYLESQGELIPVLAMESLYQLFMSKLKYKYHHEKLQLNDLEMALETVREFVALTRYSNIRIKLDPEKEPH